MNSDACRRKHDDVFSKSVGVRELEVQVSGFHSNRMLFVFVLL